MFSLVSSRYTLGLQFAFLAFNAVGVLLGTVYNAQTPDLYPGNAHHSIGWIATWVVSAHVLIGLIGRVARRFGGGGGQRRSPSAESHHHHHHFVRVPTEGGEHGSLPTHHGFRLSDDSGQGTEPLTESLRSNSVSTAYDEDGQPSPYKEFDDEESRDFEAMTTSAEPPSATGWAAKAVTVVSWRVWKYVELGYKVMDRIILPFGFLALATGVITFARFFVRLSLQSPLKMNECDSPNAEVC